MKSSTITKRNNNEISIFLANKTASRRNAFGEVGRDENGKPINAFYKAYNEDPIKNQVIQNYLFMATKGYTDFSKINNVATSNVSKQIDEVLRNNGASFLENGGVNFNNRSEESTFSLGGDLKLDI